jgi:acetyl esterase
MMGASCHVFDAPTGELAVIRDLSIDGPGGALRLRLFDAREQRGPGPAMLFIHGGGWVIGDLDTHGPLCPEVSRRLDLPVLAVDYRLAPEHPFPAGVEDSIAAARWLASSPEELEREITGLIVAGDSAGGNIAIVAAMSLRDEPAAVPVIGQWLIYPAADPATRYPSFEKFNRNHLLTKEGMKWFEDCYAGRKDDWRFSPMLRDQAGMPRTLVVTASLDPIRDQGRAYAATCAEAGVETVFVEAEGSIHGFLNLRKALPSAEDDLTQCLDYLRCWLGRGQ